MVLSIAISSSHSQISQAWLERLALEFILSFELRLQTQFKARDAIASLAQPQPIWNLQLSWLWD